VGDTSTEGTYKEEGLVARRETTQQQRRGIYDVHASINRFYSHGEQDFERYPGPARRAGVVSLRKGRSTVNGNKGSVMYTVINIVARIGH
jgi:hypothetical protein